MKVGMTYLAAYKYIFMVALLTAEAMFLYRLPRRSHFLARTVSAVLILLMLISIYPSDTNTALSNALMFGTFFLASLGVIVFCFNIRFPNAVFCAIAGYTIQHIASNLYTVLCTLGGFGSAIQIYSNQTAHFDLFTVFVILEVYFLVYWIMYHLFSKRIQREEAFNHRSPLYLAMLALVLLVEIVLSTIVTEQYSNNMVVPYYLCASLTNLLCSLLILMLLFETLIHRSLEIDLQVEQHMREQEHRQYDISKETIDMINVKCHDMKHQIHAIRQSVSIDPEALREVEQSISIYDSIVKTDNEALDTILAEKGLYCQRHDISINCIIDGHQLDFMSAVDIYALFGNILDNAIRSVITLDKDRRFISLSVKTRDKLLVINSHNYYQGIIKMKDGIPQSDRADSGYHGFGIRSIKQIVEKYHGSIIFETADNIFNVSMMFPICEKLPEKEA